MTKIQKKYTVFCNKLLKIKTGVVFHKVFCHYEIFLLGNMHRVGNPGIFIKNRKTPSIPKCCRHSK